MIGEDSSSAFLAAHCASNALAASERPGARDRVTVRAMDDDLVYEEAVVNMTVFDHAPDAVKRRVHEEGDLALKDWWDTLSWREQDSIINTAKTRVMRLRLDNLVSLLSNKDVT
jgi:hypothetical protein